MAKIVLRPDAGGFAPQYRIMLTTDGTSVVVTEDASECCCCCDGDVPGCLKARVIGDVVTHASCTGRLCTAVEGPLLFGHSQQLFVGGEQKTKSYLPCWWHMEVELICSGSGFSHPKFLASIVLFKEGTDWILRAMLQPASASFTYEINLGATLPVCTAWDGIELPLVDSDVTSGALCDLTGTTLKIWADCEGYDYYYYDPGLGCCEHAELPVTATAAVTGSLPEDVTMTKHVSLLQYTGTGPVTGFAYEMFCFDNRWYMSIVDTGAFFQMQTHSCDPFHASGSDGATTVEVTE